MFLSIPYTYTSIYLLSEMLFSELPKVLILNLQLRNINWLISN
jgi:hypothetical protein